jgi:hypothetical protein
VCAGSQLCRGGCGFGFKTAAKAGMGVTAWWFNAQRTQEDSPKSSSTFNESDGGMARPQLVSGAVVIGRSTSGGCPWHDTCHQAKHTCALWQVLV